MKNFIEEFYYGNIEPQARMYKAKQGCSKTNEDPDPQYPVSRSHSVCGHGPDCKR